MILKHGNLGSLKETNLNTLIGNQYNGIYEINDPNTISSYYNFPDDRVILERYFIRNVNGRNILEETIRNRAQDNEKYNMYLAYKHYSTPCCTGILEISSYEDITSQIFTRLPDGTIFMRAHDGTKWSAWKRQLTDQFNMMLREINELNMWSYNEILRMSYEMIPIFNDSYLWQRLGTKMHRGSYDRLVWNDRPDYINSTTTVEHLVTPKINFNVPGRTGDFGLLYERAWDGGHGGLHWLFRWNNNPGDNNLYIGNNSDPSNLFRYIIHSHRNLVVHNRPGIPHRGRLITRDEWNFKQTAGAGHVVLPQRPSYDLHVYVLESVMHFIPGHAKWISLFDTSNDLENIWVRYDGGQTITCDRGHWIHVNWR